MKTIVTIVSAVLALSACGSTDNTAKRQAQTEAAISWHAMLTDEEKAQLCDIYFTNEKEVIIDAFVTGDNPMSPAQAEEFYAVMTEEC